MTDEAERAIPDACFEREITPTIEPDPRNRMGHLGKAAAWRARANRPKENLKKRNFN